MDYTDGEIHDVVVKELRKFSDRRGWLIEIYRSDELPEAYLPTMSYISETLPGVARGPHEHVDQTDTFGFVGPSTFRLYLWDRREDSPTAGRRMIMEVGEEKPAAVTIPPGVVHAYKNVGPKPGWVINCPNRLYAGEGKKEPVDEIRHEDDPESPFQLVD
ncbi:dTDP-4-dehydrorhamnose 3,5-epimerase family protein [Planctomycetes bacterium Pan216]|uniref:dTDP-4-dehydrorhamnose 3,5-epimerase family protein n=1 Tax=Kolteria novifilia TaxID=2527975 RepID=UPI0011A2805B